MNRLETIKKTFEEYLKADKTFGIYDAPDFTDDVDYLLQRLERYETALQYIITAQDYEDYWPANIAEEALKEE